jgi:RND superfamily putative drug exporter
VFGRLGRTVVRHPWWTIIAWLAAAVAIIAFSPKLSDITKADQGSFLPSKYESVQALNLAKQAFPQHDENTVTALVVVKRSDGRPLTQADTVKAGQVAQALQSKHIKTVTNVQTGPQAVAPNRSSQLVSVTMRGKSPDDRALIDAVREIRKELPAQLQGSGLTTLVGGDPATFADNEDSFNTALEIVGLATFVLIVGLILLIFRAPLAALLPIVVIGVVLQVSSSLVALAGKVFGFNVDQSLQTIILIVLFGIGTDYMLFLLFRYRERLRAGDDKKTAMIVAVERVGEVIASAAGAVIVAFLVLLLATFGGFGSLGPALAISVGAMLVTALTLIPAIISLLGTAVFWPSKAWRKQPTANIPARLGRMVGRRPGVVALVTGGMMILLAVGTFGFKADYDFNAGFPQNTESARATKQMQKGFPAGLLTPTEVYLRSTNGQPVSKSQVAAFTTAVKSAPGVGSAQPAAEPSQNPNVARVDVALKNNPLSNESISLVRGPLRDAVHRAAPPGTQALVGGTTAIFADINSANNRDLSVILPVAAVLIALILALLLRSLVAPIYLVAAVLLGFAATIGSAVYVYMGGLDKPGITFQLPIIMYLFVLAIGTDYNILMIARLREEAKEGHEPRRAAALAVEHGAPTVGAAGLILAGTFAALMLAPVLFLKELGFGVAIGIMLSAFVMSAFLVPSLTALIGHKAWWPGHGDRPDSAGGTADFTPGRPEPVRRG